MFCDINKEKNDVNGTLNTGEKKISSVKQKFKLKK